MIIRNNLSSSPTTNHTLFSVACVALLIAAVAFTGFNVKNLATGYMANNKLEAQIVDQQKSVLSLKQESDQLNQKIMGIKTRDFVNETSFVNEAIRKRVFSWTTLFDQLEQSLPGNVKMVSVTPTFSESNIKIEMEVSGRGLNDIVDLVRRLQASPVFKDVYFANEHRQDDGLHVSITLLYLAEKVPEAEKAVAQQSAAVPSPDTQEEQQ